MKSFILAFFLVVAVIAHPQLRQDDLQQGLNGYHSAHAEHMNKISSGFKKIQSQRSQSELREKALRSIDEQINAQRKRDTPDCLNAWVSLAQEFNSSDCRDLEAASDKVFNKEDVTKASVTSFCQNTCPGKIKAGIRNVVAKCPRKYFLVTNFKELYAFLTIIRLPCFKHKNEYCLPRVHKYFAETPTGDPTEASLKAFCHPCLKKFLIIVAAISNEVDKRAFVKLLASIEFICLKSFGRFCWHEFNLMDKETKFENQLNILCRTTCTKKIFAFALLFDATLVEVFRAFKIFGFLCSRDLDGNYCFLKFADENAKRQATEADECLSSFTAGKPCDAQCKAILSYINTKAGCCMGVWVRLLAFTYANATNTAGKPFLLQLNAARTVIQTKCGVKIGLPCRTRLQRRVKFRIVLRNLLCTYWRNVANKARLAKLIKALIDDAARNSGVENEEGGGSSVTKEGLEKIELIAGDKCRLVVNITIKIEDDEAATKIKEQLNAEVKDDEYANTKTEEESEDLEGVEDLADENGNLPVDSTNSVAETEDTPFTPTSSAVKSAASLFLIAFALVFLF